MTLGDRIALRLEHVSPRTRESALVVTACAIIAFVTLSVTLSFLNNSTVALGDFRGFYCAGQVAAAHHDPYLTVPLANCERALVSGRLFGDLGVRVVPAPIPGYSVWFFSLVSRLPLWLAGPLWFLLLVLATIAAAVLIVRVLPIPVWAFGIALSTGLYPVSLLTGELIPLALLGLALIAYGAMRDRPIAIAAGLALAMFEPQVGFLVGITLVALQPKRLAIVAAVFALLAAISVLELGVTRNVEYLTVVLPTHVFSELHAEMQFSSTWIAATLGAPPALAVIVGRLGYAMAFAASLWLARAPRMRAEPALMIFVAAAFAAFGSPYLHLDHVALAIPAAFAIASAPYRRWTFLVAAPVLLALPLLYVLAYPLTILAVPVVTAWIVESLLPRAGVAVRSAACALGVTLIVGLVAVHQGFGTSSLAHVSPNNNGFASGAWQDYVVAHRAAHGWTIWLSKLPTWFGMVLTIAGALAYGLGGLRADYRPDLTQRRRATVE